MHDPLKEIAEELRTQDNLGTRDPMFCVQVCERIGPIIPEYGDDHLMFHDHREMETYYEDDPDPERWLELYALNEACELPSAVSAGRYVERWFTVQTCFTREGCERHLRENGHNYRHYNGTRIYVEFFYRNPEMIAIREFLLKQGEQNG